MGFYRNDEGSSGFGGRIFLAAIIALFGLFTYWSNTQENPVTHEKQHVSLSPQQEIQLGLQSAPKMSREMGGEVAISDPRAQEVSRIGMVLMDHSDAKKSPWKFQFHLLADTKTINAFALPGGQIFITLGLYNELQSEAQLAGVLGHEMGHVIERHSAQQMAKGELGNILVGAVAVGASNPQNYSSRQGFNPAIIASVVNQMIQLRYSRHDESEADLWGVRIMSQAGFDPKAMLEVLEILKKAGGGSMPEIFETHPNPDLRIERIKDFLAQHPPQKGLEEGKSLPK